MGPEAQKGEPGFIGDHGIPGGSGQKGEKGLPGAPGIRVSILKFFKDLISIKKV